MSDLSIELYNIVNIVLYLMAVAIMIVVAAKIAQDILVPGNIVVVKKTVVV